MAKLELHNLTKVFASASGPVRALESLTFRVEDGETLALVGPSGSGKSTALRLIAGLDSPDSGLIRFDGHDMASVPAGKRDVAMVFQNHALYPHMTAAQNILFGLRVRGIPKLERESRVSEVASLLQISGCLNRIPAELSGGERQRVAIARALARKPSVLLMDEPLSNLDLPLRAQFRAEWAQLKPKLKATVIYVTHDQVEALAVGDKVGVLYAGHLQQIGNPTEVYDKPANSFIAGFLGSPSMNLLEGALVEREGKLWFESQPAQNAGDDTPTFKTALPGAVAEVLRSRSDGRITLGIRPEDVQLTAPEGSDAQAQVLGVEWLGAFQIVQAGQLKARCGTHSRFRIGDVAEIALNWDRVSWFDATGSRAA